MEVSNEIERRNMKVKIKNKCKDKYNLRVDELQKNFKVELTRALDQYYNARDHINKKDFLIKKLIKIIV